jgi:hypothetical protein
MEHESMGLRLTRPTQTKSNENQIPEQELSMEKVGVMEKARKGRLAVLESYLEPLKKYIKESPTLKAIGSNALNDAGPFGTFKQTHEAIVGKTWDGKDLTPLGRINHIIVHVLYVYAIKESFGVVDDPSSAILNAGSAYTASWLFDMIQYYPNTISNLANKLEKGLEKTGQDKLLEATKFIRGWVSKIDPQKLFFYEKETK